MGRAGPLLPGSHPGPEVGAKGGHGPMAGNRLPEPETIRHQQALHQAHGWGRRTSLSLGRKSAWKAVGAVPGCGAQPTGVPGRPILLAAFHRSGYPHAFPLLSCWRFTTQTSSPSSLECLRTPFPGANLQEG